MPKWQNFAHSGNTARWSFGFSGSEPFKTILRSFVSSFVRGATTASDELFLKIGQTRPLFCLFSSFSQHNEDVVQNLTIKSVDRVLGTRTLGGRMEGADESTELVWRHPRRTFTTRLFFCRKIMSKVITTTFTFQKAKLIVVKLELSTSCVV